MLQEVEERIAAIQSQANELLDQLQTLSRADARALRARPEWRFVNEWQALLTERAKLRDAVEIESLLAPRPRKLRRDIHLTEEARRHLRKVWRARTLHEPGLTEDEIANAAILALAEPPAADWNGEVL